MKMRHELESGRKLYTHDVDAGLRRIAVKNGSVRAGAHRRHFPVELALSGVPAERIACGTLVAALGTRNPVILVDLHDLATHAGGDLAQLAFLIGRGLLDCGNPKVENRVLAVNSASNNSSCPRLSQGHCALMPANLITLAHFSVSSAISLPNSAG